MTYSVLVDVTKCIGCLGCQVACKNWNERPAEKTTLGETLANPPGLDSSSYTVVKLKEGVGHEGVGWHFTKHQCMHCAEPACANACPCNALRKTPEGPVVYSRANCIGCRYCMLACPFEVPAFEWNKAIPSIQKCTFCSERLASGVEPACTKSCPSGALTFGKREDVLGLAESRISRRPGKYVNYVYGKEEVGGTSWVYITDTGFRNLYLREDLGKAAYPSYSWKVMGKVPGAAVGIAALMAGFFIISSRKDKLSGKGGGE